MKHKYRTRIQGESLQGYIRDLEYKIYETFMFPLFFFVMALISWLLQTKWYHNNLIMPIELSVFTILCFVWSFIKIRKIRKKLILCRKGLEGERLVGQMLEKLTNDTTYVFHDIPGSRFNVDHIIVSSRGIFAIETKHFDRQKSHEFFFDGNMVYRQMKNGKLFFCLKFLPQMDGEAHYLQEEIEKRIDMKVPVIKVAILVGCFIRTPDDTGKCMKRYFNKYWILNESLFSSMFLEEKEIYDRSMVKLISSHINEWVKIDIDA